MSGTEIGKHHPGFTAAVLLVFSWCADTPLTFLTNTSCDLDLWSRNVSDVSVSVKTLLRWCLDGSGSRVAAVSGPVLGYGCCAPPHQKEHILLTS